MTDWDELTEYTLDELKNAPEHYRPTNFWGPGLEDLLHDMRTEGMENFKSWRRARRWFYPMYLKDHGLAARDFDVARITWNRAVWPVRLIAKGESRVGNPPELHRLLRTNRRRVYGRAYLNYMLMLSALSQHVDEQPRSFLEIGGGFGALGEFVMCHDPTARYVDLDIPPLISVASYYLRERFDDRVRWYDDELRRPGPITLHGSAVLPSYRIDDLTDDFEVFMNSFSFQEMEPDVVERYVDAVCARGIRYAVSLNSAAGKPQASEAGEWGALEPVTSDLIVRLFEARGFTAVGRHREPMVRSAGELVVLKRTGADAKRPDAAPGSAVRRVRSGLARRIAPTDKEG